MALGPILFLKSAEVIWTITKICIHLRAGGIFLSKKTQECYKFSAMKLSFGILMEALIR